ncbi:hypothetical protein SRB5_53090 [Streptomyces sp. RB5]|uniref:Uncharacterized protein n=1 Tax=Streptomyces smaragdinus TaxID=2585196 RepID=A0A7K0CNZ8_9ACTN|nr:hypothetical protein [Streptomyces smaragdinus]MQY15131.1 hypothetical protein [Streptomyces smaragdinus]
MAILCNILTSGNGSGTADTVKISVAPWGLQSLDGRIEFEVQADQLTHS